MIVKFFLWLSILKNKIQLRFIEFMDVGSTNGWNFEQVVTKEQLIEKINRVYQLNLLNLVTLEKLRNCIDM